MRKILAIIISIMLVLSVSGCGNGDSSEIKEKTATKKLMEKFDKSATIEKTVLYDENGIKITADSLTYTNFTAEIKFIFENNSDKDLSFTSGSMGYHVNSVNGYMIDDGYINCDVAAGQTAEDEFSVDFRSLNVYGITKIADIEIGFEINDDDYNSVETGPLKIKTSIADGYDYSENTYRKVIENGAFESKMDCKIDSFSEEVLYDNYDLKVASAAVVTNKDNESIVLLEIENNSEYEITVGIGDVYFGELNVYDSIWDSELIPGKKKYVMGIELNNLADHYYDEEKEEETEDADKKDEKTDDFIEISELSFSFSVGESAYDPEDSQKITLSLPKIKIEKD